jgi:hypothetical protein
MRLRRLLRYMGLSSSPAAAPAASGMKLGMNLAALRSDDGAQPFNNLMLTSFYAV